jgi:hypothetical protein
MAVIEHTIQLKLSLVPVCHGSAGAVKGVFLFATGCRPTLEPTQPPIQWVQWVFSRPGREADHYLHPVPRLKCVELYYHSPMHLHGVVPSEAQGQL